MSHKLPEEGFVVMCGDDREQSGVQVHILATRSVFRTYDGAEEYCKTISVSRNPVIVSTAAIHRLVEQWRPADEDAVLARADLNAREINILKRINEFPYGCPERMGLWYRNRKVFDKFQKHGLIQVTNFKAAHAFDVDSRVAKLTPEGESILRKEKQ